MIVSSITSKLLYKYSKVPLNISNFTHLASIDSPSRNLTLHQYSHNLTKARVYHFECQDSEKAYASIIKTYVSNSKGCPHILQHLACCGSHKYPIRDPFFNMIKRSVNTYMNAWTGDDFTAYPFASANSKDWDNLYKVYLDMSLKPLLNKLDFLQQGWRYELNEAGQKQLKGIVLNEMKGAYQDSDRQLMFAINESLLKGTPYAFDSGGLPQQIAQLQYQQLKRMYQHYYNPSNMAFYYYGKGSIQNQLNFLEQQYLSKYSDQSKRYGGINLTPEKVTQKYRDIITTNSECNNISINYFLGQTQNITPLESTALKIISYLLLEKTNALLYKKFIESGTALNIGFSGLNEGKLTVFAFTLKGIYPEYQCAKFQQQFRSVLSEMISSGIEQQRVQQFVHQFLIKQLTPRENNGIRILQQCIPFMNHQLDLQSYLNPNQILEQAVTHLQDKAFITQIINKFFINNPQMVVVRQLLAETQIQQEIIVSNVQIPETTIKQEQEDLKKRQLEVQDASILPLVGIADLVRPVRVEPRLVQATTQHNKKYNQYHVPINEDINFYRLAFNFQTVDQPFLQKLMLWVHTLNNTISTANHSYNQLASKLANTTAGFSVTTSLGQGSQLNVIFEFSCLKKNIHSAFDLVQEIVLSPKFQRQHTLNSYKSFANEYTESLIQSPMQECISEGASHLTESAYISNSYQRIKEALQIVKTNEIEAMFDVSGNLHHCSNVTLIEHSNQTAIQTPKLIHQLLKIQQKRLNKFKWSPSLISKAVVHNYSVNFCSQHYLAPKLLSAEHAHINLLLQLLQQEYLHPKIREQGGAYGSGARVRGAGTIALTSYLDPNPERTFSVFDQSVSALLSKHSIENEKLNEAKIMQLGQVDRPKTPQNEGVNQILRGYKAEEYDVFRHTLQNATFKQAIETGRKYLNNDHKSRCLFGKQTLPGFTEEKLKDFLL